MTVRRYHKLNFRTYKPRKRVRVTREGAFPVAIDVGSKFTELGGLVGFFITSFLLSFKTYRKTKKRLRAFQRRFEKIVDLRL